MAIFTWPWMAKILQKQKPFLSFLVGSNQINSENWQYSNVSTVYRCGCFQRLCANGSCPRYNWLSNLLLRMESWFCSFFQICTPKASRWKVKRRVQSSEKWRKRGLALRQNSREYRGKVAFSPADIIRRFHWPIILKSFLDPWKSVILSHFYFLYNESLIDLRWWSFFCFILPLIFSSIDSRSSHHIQWGWPFLQLF